MGVPGRNRPNRMITIVLGLTVVLTGAAAGALFGERSVSDDRQLLIIRASHIVTTLMEWLPVKPDPADIVYDGIGGMLDILDPHSNYLDPRNYRKMRSRQEGAFFGVGIIISRREGKVTVIAPIAGTPAAAKGLRAGDAITAVEGRPTEQLSLDDVVDEVRGPEGTPVRLTIKRPGMTDEFEVEITRARIPQNSVRFAFMLEPGVGYIRLSDFTNTSAREIHDAIERLTGHGMERLVLDLRNNPGGSLDAAIGVSDAFLVEGQLIVSTRGRTEENNATYRAPGHDDPLEGPLVVLVNEGSASASEIVAGAVQDHDRGLVLGETTWGKGLVQTVFSVRDTGLALTTARYYTPSGRLIQRDYQSYIDYVTHRNGVSPEDEPTEVYETDAGRTVLGGGGIMPDVSVPARELSEPIVRMYGGSAFFRFAVELLRDIPDAEEKAFAAAFEVDEATLERLLGWVGEQEILDSDGLTDLRADPIAIQDARRGLDVEVLNATLGLEAGYRAAIGADEQVAAALRHMEDAADMWVAWLQDHG